jgi:YVTN family beta-propeller protein
MKGLQLCLVCVGLALAGHANAVSFAYIPNSDSNDVSIIDTSANAVIATVPVGDSPGGVAVNTAGTRVYVANSVSNNVSVLDTSTNAVIATVPVGMDPSGIAVNPAGTQIYVANADVKSVSVIDATSLAVVATIPVGTTPIGIAFNPAGTRAYVANFDSDNVSVIDTATRTVVATISVGFGPFGVAVNPAGSRIYVTNFVMGTVTVIDAASNTVVATITVGLFPQGVVVDPSGTRLYAATALESVIVIDATANTVLGAISVAGQPTGIATTPDGTRVYVADAAANNVTVINAATNAIIATVTVGTSPIGFGQFIGPDIAPVPVAVVEFYNAGLDHYFITWVPQEISDLDTGVHVGWKRTGKTFKTFTSAVAGTSQVCRFYIPPAQGDSHFFGRGQMECDDTARKFPTFTLEDPKFMQMFLPAAGVCPVGTIEIYRVFSNRADANHRYMTEKAVRDSMVAKGWVAEGDGPNLVVMCAPA